MCIIHIYIYMSFWNRGGFGLGGWWNCSNTRSRISIIARRGGGLTQLWCKAAAPRPRRAPRPTLHARYV